MKITDKEKTKFLLKLAKEHYTQGDDYHAWKSKKNKWHFGHSNDHELQHGQGKNTIIDDSMLEILMNRELVNNLDIPVVGSSLPDLQECTQASLDYATKKDNPDFFLIKQTFKEGINWALNYITKPK